MLGCVNSLRSKRHNHRSEPWQGCCELTEKSEKRETWKQVEGVSLGRAAAACPLVASLMGIFRDLDK